jgi:DNA polymerase II small subunit
MENVILVPNPSLVRIAISDKFPGLDVLIYHGDSYDYYMDQVDYLRVNNSKLKPDLIMQFLLKKRHLAPTHTSTTYFPCEKDLLAIRKLPDILVSGHIHKSAVSRYNGILTISCSCWQAKTGYQEKFGHEPDPCKIPLVNLQTGKASILDFS